MRIGELAVSGFMGVVGVYFLISARFTQHSNPLDVGPAFFPKIVSVGLIVLACMQLVSSLKKHSADKVEIEWRYVGFTALIALAYTMAWDIGYIITTSLLLLSLMLLGGIRRIPLLLTIAVGYSVSTFYLFGQLLKVPLP